MSVRGVLVGAAAGALAAVAVWQWTGPTDAESPGPPREVHAELVGSANTERLPPAAKTAVDEQRAPENARNAVESAPDPVFHVIAFGRVTDEVGVPVTGARPILESEDAIESKASSGPEGRWSLLGLEPGEFDLRIDVEGFLPHRERVRLPAARQWRHDVQLAQARSLPVRFESPSGEALVPSGFGDVKTYLGVCATKTRPVSPLLGVRGRVIASYGEGRFHTRADGGVLPDLDPRYQGVLHLNGSPPLWVSLVLRDEVLESRPLALDEEELVFVVREEDIEAAHGEVRVRLIERATGVPIETGLQLTHPSGGLRAKAEIVDGTHVFRNVPAGTMDLMHEGPLEWLERGVRVPAGGVLDLGTIALAARQDFELRVRDEDGAPLATGIQATRTELAGSPADLNVRMNIQSNAEGIATIRHLGPGVTLLRAGGRDGWARTAKQIDTSRSQSFELVLAHGVEVVFLRGADAPPGREYVLEDSAGLPLVTGSSLRREVFLRPGNYVLRGLEGDLEVERTAFAVGTERTIVRFGGA